MIGTSIISNGMTKAIALFANVAPTREEHRPVVAAKPTASTAVIMRTADAAGTPVVALSGKLDARSCDALIREAAALHARGAAAVTIDLTHVDGVSLCGVYALHAIAAVFAHAAAPDEFSSRETGLRDLRRLAEANLARGHVAGIRLTCPDATLRAKLVNAGMDEVYELVH